jgi:DNA invertase Pin-like site-specific DNA recombinase
MTDLTSLESVPQCHWNRNSTPRRLPANCHIFRCPLAQFERRLIAERTRDGMNAARAKGSRPLRPPLNPEKLEATLLLVKGDMSPTKTARRTALGRSTLYRGNPSAGSCLPLAYVLEQILR